MLVKLQYRYVIFYLSIPIIKVSLGKLQYLRKNNVMLLYSMKKTLVHLL